MMLRPIFVVLLLSTATLTGACSVFNRGELPYREAANQPPLQVPSDLDRPVFDDSLRIPDVSATASASNAGPRSLASANANILALNDDADSLWRRTGLALQRLGSDVEVLTADQASSRYQVAMTGTRPAQGTFRRLLRRSDRVQETFNLIIEPAGAGATIRAEGGGAFARDLLQRLAQRLG